MHQHEHTKAVLNRMSRAIGHMNAVKKMIEEGRDCSEVLIQLAAVRAEITNTSNESYYDVHHIRPLEYGGAGMDYDNLIHLPVDLHRKVTGWFNGY